MEQVRGGSSRLQHRIDSIKTSLVGRLNRRRLFQGVQDLVEEVVEVQDVMEVEEVEEVVEVVKETGVVYAEETLRNKTAMDKPKIGSKATNDQPKTIQTEDEDDIVEIDIIEMKDRNRNKRKEEEKSDQRNSSLLLFEEEDLEEGEAVSERKAGGPTKKRLLERDELAVRDLRMTKIVCLDVTAPASGDEAEVVDCF